MDTKATFETPVFKRKNNLGTLSWFVMHEMQPQVAKPV